MHQGRSHDVFAAAASQDSGPPIGQLVLRRKWLLLFGLAVGIGLGYLYFTQQNPVFKSYAWILVTPNRTQLPTEQVRSDDSLADEIETQCQIVMSRVVLEDAVEQGNLATLPEFGDWTTALVSVSRGLTVEPVSKYSRHISISYLGSSPTETKAVVEAVANAYRDFLSKTDNSVSANDVKILEEAQNNYIQELTGLEKKYSDFRTKTTLLAQGEGRVNPHAVRLTDIEAERTGLILRESQLQAKIDAISQALQRGGSREALSLMVNQLKEEGGQRSGAAAIAEKLFPLLLEKELLSENLGPGHPKLVAIDKRISMTRKHLDDLLNLGGTTGRQRDLLDVYLDSMRYEIATTQVQKTSLDRLYEEESQKAKELEIDLATDRELREAIRRNDQALTGVATQLKEMSLYKVDGIHTELMAKPTEGVRTPVERTKFMCVGGAIGLIVTAVLAYMLESCDKSFRTPEDIRDELGVAVVGHLPVIPTKGVPADSPVSSVLCTIHASKGRPSEAFRLVRTALFFGARNGDLRVIQITSPDQGDGKSTISGNLAVSVAQSGRRTLLIDADMRRPTVHRIFGLGNEAGISGVVAGQIEPVDAIHETDIPNLSILPCGPRPHNPAELLASKQFEEFLGWARDNYDFVIIDTPPLLAVSDPSNVASRVDGVLLALRLGKKARAKGHEAREILERVGANVLGVIINGVNARGEHGYQSGYRYTSASSSRYGYGEAYYSNEYVEPERKDRLPSRRVNGSGTKAVIRDV